MRGTFVFQLGSYKPGANLTIMNTLAANFKDDKEKFHEGLILVYKDCDSGIKYKSEITDPDYTFYIAKDDKRLGHNRLFIEKDSVIPITVHHRDVEKEIAKLTGNKQFFYDNAASGNRKENQRLHAHPDIFRSDINIEDYYRFVFDQTYKNEPCKVTKSFLDIESDTISMIGDFPQLGECPVNAVTLVLQDMNQAYTFLLETKSNPLIQDFKKSVEDGSVFPELKQFITDAVNGPDEMVRFGLDQLQFNFLFYKEDDEINLIKDVFAAINNFKPDFCLAWNMSFDVPYLIERIKVLGYKPEDIICHPDFDMKFCQYYVDERMKNEFAERGDFALISSYTTYIDQMIQYASRRKGQGRPLSFSLDYIGELVAKVKKLDYKHITTNISELPYKDYKTFVFYNIMDVIVQVCIEKRTGDIEYMFSKSIVNNTRYAKVHRQTVYLTNRGMKEFDQEGFVIGNNTNKFNPKPDNKFPGAFVAQMDRIKDTSKMKVGGIPIRVFENLDDFDYSSLYPSIYRQFNLAANTQIGMIQIPEQISEHENRQKDPTYSRGGQFLEDFQSHVWLEICTRWFGLANFTDLVKDVERFFTTIIMPSRGLRIHTVDGKIMPMFFMEEESSYPIYPMIFDSDIVEEHFEHFNREKAEVWRKYAVANINQQFK